MKHTGGELLAPAGNMECLKAAVAAGADAVYLGGQKFGARAFAGNFSDEELQEALRLAHFFQKKIYLTINTLTKEQELKELAPWLSPFYEAGLDGVIIQDIGVLECCRRAFPDLELHASTQMTVTENRSALFLKALGVSRIVPARELSLEEIIRLKRETGMEIETFIHGALCYCYSGQCLFSSFLGGRSGNRGRCAQPCRLPYTILTNGNTVSKKGNQNAEQYPLSLKDLCVLPFLPKLLEAGIDSFKIEGRMKSPEYVAGVTALYRKYIDRYRSDAKNWKVEEEDLFLLSHLYVRSEVGGGYYEQHNGREMITLQKPGYSACPEEIPTEIRRRYLEAELTKEVNMRIYLENGKAAVLQAECDGVRTEEKGAVVMPAKKRPLTAADVEKQLRKTGGSHFEPGELEIAIQGDVFLPVSSLNDLRRQTLTGLWEKTAASSARIGKEISSGRRAEEPEELPLPSDRTGKIETMQRPCLYVSVLTAAQATEALLSEQVRRLYLSADAVLSADQTDNFMQQLYARKKWDPDFSFCLMLPAILRAYSDNYLGRLSGWTAKNLPVIDGFLAGSLSGLLWAKEAFPGKKRSAQHGFYVFNRETWRFFMRHFQLDTYTAPLELNRHELVCLPAANQEMSVYGKMPMMISAGCVKRTAGGCQVTHTQRQLSEGIGAEGFQYALKDRYQAQFPVFVNCRHCMNTIYNSVPLSLHQYLPEIGKRGIRAFRLDFTDEMPGQIRQLIRYFAEGEGMSPAAYTTGHYKKGVQ